MSNNKTELIWKGKYDENGVIHKIDRIALPFQVVETVNEPRRASLGLDFGGPKNDTWKNKLIWGDNKYVMASLLKGDKSIGLEPMAGKINLIYIDPPFDVGADFSAKIKIGDEEVTKEPTFLEQKAYNDTWGEGTDSYLQMMYDRLALMRDLLAGDGSIYVHLDWHVGHYVKVLMDEIFGKENFRNEIIWGYTGPSRQNKDFPDKHDVIYRFSKTPNYKFFPDKIRVPYVKLETGKTSGIFKKEAVLDEKGKIPEDWWVDITPVARLHATELLDYPTQKPVAILERILKASSNDNDIVLDIFCGSGTTMEASQKLGRRWIGCDLGKFAIHTSRKRLMQIPDCTFELLNLGKYERQVWQSSKLNQNGEKEAEKIKNYLKFIVELYHAEWLNNFKYLHGKKANKMVHVGAIDAPVTLDEVANAVSEAKENGINKLDVLGWDWSHEVNEIAKSEAKNQGVEVHLLQIPREVMDSIAVQKGDVEFFELAAVDVNVKKEKNAVKVELTGFISPNDELLPEEVRDKIKSWTDWIDYWAVDFDFDTKPEKSLEDDTFHNMWQSYRTKKEPRLSLTSMSHTYENPGTHKILIKVVDIFGNDTTKLVEVKI